MEINSSKKKKKKFEDEYKILEELLSKKVKIYKVQSKKDRLTCRMMHSIQKTSFCNLNDDKIMSKEFELLSKLSHPNIIKLFTFYTTDINFNIISEYFKEGTLDTKIRKHKIFTENQAKHVCSQLLNVVKYLNENNLVHTDITPDIIYIQEIVNEKNQELYNIKILQFGSSTINIHNSNNSLYYTSPELLNNKYHKTSDIWSIGIILYQMIYDDLPFKGYKEDEIINNIKKLKVHPPDKAHHTLLSKCLKNLIKRMLNKNPFKRIKVDECLNHEWFTGIPNIDDEDTESVNSKIDLNKEINENKKKEEINTNDKKYKKSNFKTKKEESKKSDISDSDESSENSSDSFSTQKKSEFESNKFSKKKILAISDKNKGKENKIIENKNRNENENKNIINNNKNHEIAKSYSSNMIEVLSSKSNGQKVPPLLIDTIKYIKYYVQINYKRAMEEEKINKIFDKIASKKINKNDNNEIKLTNEDLYLGFLNYIGQKIFNLDSYSDNKKLFINLSNSINENKKNGNAINSSYDKNEFLKTLIILKEKYYEHNLEKSYQQLKKSNTKEIINCFNEIDKKSEYSYFKHYIKEMKSIIMKNKYKEIYLFFEFKNLIINSIKNMYNQKDNKKKVKINVENDNKSFRRNNSESTKNNGIRGIIKLVDKKGK